jgi:ribosomal protein S21
MSVRIKIDLSNGMKMNTALKIFKEKSKIITDELKERKEFTKKSVKRRELKRKAIYKQQINQ